MRQSVTVRDTDTHPSGNQYASDSETGAMYFRATFSEVHVDWYACMKMSLLQEKWYIGLAL